MILTADSISKKYFRPTKAKSHFEAVKKTTLALAPGAITEIIGRSGSGKSTLLYMMAGLLKPSEGTVLLDGTDLYALGDKPLSRLRNESFGVIPQGQTGLFALTAVENVTLPATLRGDSSHLEGRAHALLETLGIAHLAHARISELSGGELRRVAVARALVHSPKIIFADEPTDDLDDENTKTVLELLRKAADGGASVLLVTHEPTAEAYADTVFRMSAGEIESVKNGE